MHLVGTVVQTEILAVLVICLSAVNWRVMRTRSFWMRLASSGVLFVALTAVVIYLVDSPLQPAFKTPAAAADALGQQAIVAAWWALGARLLVEVVRATRFGESFTREGRLPSDLLAGLIYLIAAFMIASAVFGLPIRAIVATSGVIAIVLGLALQSTLADVFSGIAVGIERPYSVGDRVSVDGAPEGVVTEINWRSLRILTDSNDVATIPNSLAAKSRIINRSVPTSRRGASVTVPCAANVPPERAIELIQRAVLLCPTILASPRPAVALTKVGRRSHDYEVGFSVAESSILWATKSDLMEQVLRQFRSAGISTSATAASGEAAAQEGAQRMHPLAISLFQGLSDDQRRQLEDNVQPRLLASGDKLLSQGETGGSLFVVVWGVMEIARTTNDVTFTIGRISSGDYVGEMALLTGAPYAGTVTALTQSMVVELRKEHLAPLLAERADLLHMLEASARRMQSRVDRAVAASVDADGATIPPTQLLSRMRAYFRLLTHG